MRNRTRRGGISPFAAVVIFVAVAAAGLVTTLPGLNAALEA